MIEVESLSDRTDQDLPYKAMSRSARLAEAAVPITVNPTDPMPAVSELDDIN
jgi:hypothetical protein